MRVKSAFKGVFTYRLAMSSGFVIAMLAIFFVTSSFTKNSARDFRAKHVNLIIREIGHRLLLQAGDSTSRVMPVTETDEGTFLLQFENPFVFSHDSLMALSMDMLPKTQFPSGYAVTVHDCVNFDIVYGFQLNNFTPDLLPCRGRRQPSGCYSIEFAFPDFYQNIESNKAGIERSPEGIKSTQVDRSQVKSKVEESKTNKTEDDIDELTRQQSVRMDLPEMKPKLQELKTTTFNYPLMNLVYSGVLVVLGVVLLTGRVGKILMPAPVQSHDYTIIKESPPEFAALGKFSFDVKDRRLLLGSEVITLTDKECKILELLYNNFGELIPRETLMQEVWFNQGVITGRSLDMFVSKLRKKISGDPELRITNVHGKGYKLERTAP